MLATMSEPDYARLRSELSGDRFFPTEKALGQAIESAIPTVEKKTRNYLGMFVEAMAAVVQREGNQDISEVLSDMLDADNVQLSPVQKQIALDRVLELTSFSSLQTLANIRETYFKHERPLVDASIIVDVRPTFSKDNILAAMTLWQTLSVDYETSSGDEASIEFAVDTNDLLKIRDEIDSALSKIENVQSALSNAGLRMWAPTTKVDREGSK